VRGDGLLGLGLDTLICAKQWQIAVGGRGSDDLEVAALPQTSERADQIAVIVLYEGPVRGEEVLAPLLGEGGEVRLVLLPELHPILFCALRPRHQVVRELLLEVRMRELLGQHRRDPHGDLRGDSLCHQPVKDLEQGEIALGCAFEEHIGAMRPCPMREHIGKVPVKHQAERPGR
jgi:hypothetical protein